MTGRFWISVVAMFVLSMALGFVVHGTLLHGDYSKLPNLLRTEADAQGYFVWMLLAHASIAFGFTWIYTKGREPGKPFLAQGLRYGLAVCLLMTVPMYLIYYAVQPWPGAVVAKQIVYDVIGVLILGVTVAALNRDAKAPV
jgi:cytochrome bd-type quinol oxidase subunit 2